MDPVTILLGILILLVLAVGVLLFVRKPEKQSGGDMLMLQSQLNDFVRLMDQKFGAIDSRLVTSQQNLHQSIQSQHSESSKIIRDVTEKLIRLDETNKQVVNFADQLQSLQDILKNPKQRGILGEYYLEALLKNIMPPGSYEMQYKLGRDEKTGLDTIVDAAVFVKDKVIPVDSKFSLENYNRIVEEQDPSERVRLEKLFIADLKNRITETAKYIQPERGTMDFAFMFIPHEAIYYDLLINKIGALQDGDTENLIQRAASKNKVIIVSPTSFLAYLQTVLQGLRALQIEETAKDIVKRVEDLGRHLKSYEDYHTKLGKTLETTVNHYNAAGAEFKKLDKDVMRIAGTAPGLEVQKLVRPESGDIL